MKLALGLVMLIGGGWVLMQSTHVKFSPAVAIVGAVLVLMSIGVL